MQKDEIQEVLCNALEEISSEKQHQEKCLWMLVVGLQSELGIKCEGHATADAQKVPLFEKYQLMVSSVLMTSLPRHFPGIRSCLFMNFFTCAIYLLCQNKTRDAYAHSFNKSEG